MCRARCFAKAFATGWQRATAPVLRVPQLQQQKDSTNSGSLEIELRVCDSDLTVLLVHSWYSEDCCHDRDCHPVPRSEN